MGKQNYQQNIPHSIMSSMLILPRAPKTLGQNFIILFISIGFQKASEFLGLILINHQNFKY